MDRSDQMMRYVMGILLAFILLLVLGFVGATGAQLAISLQLPVTPGQAAAIAIAACVLLGGVIARYL